MRSEAVGGGQGNSCLILSGTREHKYTENIGNIIREHLQKNIWRILCLCQWEVLVEL